VASRQHLARKMPFSSLIRHFAAHLRAQELRGVLFSSMHFRLQYGVRRSHGELCRRFASTAHWQGSNNDISTISYVLLYAGRWQTKDQQTISNLQKAAFMPSTIQTL
jgi:hypothetical protein